MPKTKIRYRVTTEPGLGLNYGPYNTRAESGDVVDDLPTESIKWLLADGLIEVVKNTGGDDD